MLSISNIFPSIAGSYIWFFYLGIFLFVAHIGLYGFGIDLSYLGLLLIYLGWKKPNMSIWLHTVIWIFAVLDVIATIRGYYNKWMKIDDEPKKKKNPTFRPKKED
jgi:membrane protein implicated in regulation of membrane protease activity